MTVSPPKSRRAAPDPLLGLGLGLIALACLLWLSFMIFAVTDGVGYSLYPASEHALLFLWGIFILSQSRLAQLSERPRLTLWTNTTGAGPLVLLSAYATAALVVAAVFSQSKLVLIGAWWAIAIALKAALYLELREPRRRQPFVIAALLCGWLGAMLLALAPIFVMRAGLLAPLGKLLFFDALPQLALLGLLAAALRPYQSLLAACGFLLSAWLEAYGHFTEAFALRTLVVAPLLWLGWKGLPSPLGFWCGLIAASWLGGMAGIAIWPHYLIHLKHFIYLGVYLTLAALVLCIPLRWPSLAIKPGAAKLLTRKRFNWVVGLVALGAVTRATSYVSHASYVRHLGYAAGIILLALGLAWPAYRRWRRRSAKLV